MIGPIVLVLDGNLYATFALFSQDVERERTYLKLRLIELQIQVKNFSKKVQIICEPRCEVKGLMRPTLLYAHFLSCMFGR